MATADRPRKASLAARFAMAATAILLVLGLQSRPAAQPDCTSTAAGPDFHGQTLVAANFAHVDLQNANFRCAVFINASFVHSNLQGADFSHATFKLDLGICSDRFHVGAFERRR